MTISIFELAALAAAFSWAIANVISPRPAAHLGTIAFNRWRLSMMFVLISAYVVFMGTWRSIATDDIATILASGLIGITIGDTTLFATMNRLGPRRTAMLFALNAPISAILGWLFLADQLNLAQISGIVICTIGVIIAVAFGKRKAQLHQWEAIKGPLWIGICFGLLAALGQAVGSLIVTPVLVSGTDPVAIAALRIGVAAFCLHLLLFLPKPKTRARQPMNWSIGWAVFWSGFIAMAVGMTLVLFGLSGGQIGIISTLSATTPAMLLPLIWILTRECPAPLAWVGAGLVVIGCALIFS